MQFCVQSSPFPDVARFSSTPTKNPLAKRSLPKALAIIALLFTSLLAPQHIKAQGKPGGGNPAASTPSSNPSPASQSAPSGGGLQGISFAKESWDTALVKQNYKILGLRNAKDLVVVCYKLVPGKSATQPFLLEPVPLPSSWQGNHLYSNGEIVQPTKPNGHYYQAEVTIRSGTDNDRLSFALGAGGFTDSNGLAWEDTGTLAPSSRPAYPWKSDTSYSAGEIIKGNHDHPFPPGDHYYRARIAPVSSGISEPTFPVDKNASPVQDGAGRDGKVIDNGQYLFWKDLGLGISNANIGAQCAKISPSQPILMDQILVVAIDVNEISAKTMDRFKILNLNITNQQGASLNPTPIRPSLAQGTASGAETASLNLEGRPSAKSYFLTWPNQLPGDTIPTVSVNLIYTPVAPALRWEQGTFYPAGSIVISSDGTTTNGHYYLAINSGVSSDTPPDFNDAAVPVPTFPDGTGVYWKDAGNDMPASIPPPWSARHRYTINDPVLPSPANGHYYRAHSNGVSGSSPPQFPTDRTVVYDGDPAGLTWINKGQTAVSSAPPSWKPKTPYAPGAQVVPDGAGNGHFYQAESSGTSGSQLPSFGPDTATVPDGTGSTRFNWLNMGLVVYPSWAQGAAYALGARVVPNPANGYYYETTVPGVSGPNPPLFPLVVGTTVPEATNLIWLDAGPAPMPATIKNLKAWARETAFFSGDGIFDPSSGHYYSVIQAGISGSTRPPFSVPAPNAVSEFSSSQPSVRWQDLGTTLPASVSIGTPPSDQTVNLLTYTYPQSHALSRFNLASGVIVSSIKTRSFTNLNSSTAAAPNWTTVKNGLTLDPILAVTLYIKPIDAERRFQKSDFTPAPTLGFSLTSPTTNFYLGASSELFIRNLQLVYGLGLNKTSVLQPTLYQLSGTIPATRQTYLKGGFVGVSFNITGFIQSLFVPH